MRTLLLLLTLHAACDRPAADDEPEPTAGETVTEGDRPGSGDTDDGEGEREARAPEPERVPPPALEDWATIAQTYVTEDGGFRYEALRGNEAHLAALESTVEAVGEAQDQGWENPEALAFYVNGYNALTVAAVLEHWPIESVMRVEGFFDTLTHRVAGETMTLNALENDILRSERFSEPRIHFIVNCASKSCPPLAAEPYTAENIDGAMATASQAFVRATTELTSRKAKVSRLFEWFAEDFGGAEGVRAFIAERLEGEAAEHVRNERTEIGYQDYDWALNARAEPAGDPDGAGAEADEAESD